MHILFLDESGKPGDRAFAVGGIAVAADRWAELRQLWETALADQRWPADREAKWHGIRVGDVPPALADATVSRHCRRTRHLFRRRPAAAGGAEAE